MQTTVFASVHCKTADDDNFFCDVPCACHTHSNSKCIRFKSHLLCLKPAIAIERSGDAT